MTIKFLTAKCYSILFGCSIRTAKRQIHEDRVTLKKKRITPRHVMALHALQEEDFKPLFG